MEYPEIDVASYIGNPELGPLSVPFHTLALPSEWEEVFLRLYHYGMTDRQAEWHKRIPTKNINHLMRATAPDLVAVESTATFGADQPWLYATSPYPISVMNSFITTWLRHLQSKPEEPDSFALLRECRHLVDTGSLEWQLAMVDLLEQRDPSSGRPGPSAGGTALPATHLYRLLPEYLAQKIADHGAYEHNGKQLSFRQVAGDARAGGAELMSWPPLDYTSKNKDGDGKKDWFYSAVIRIGLRTVPFDPVPRIHLSTGVRRFVRGRVWMPVEGGVSVYLLPEESLLPDGPASPRFSVAKIAWDKNERTTDWAQGGPQGMLLDVSALPELPPVDRLVKEADHWIGGREGIAMGVTHHTAMGTHAIGTGLMPSERRRLTEWAEEAIAPDFVRVPRPKRSKLSPKPKRQLEELKSRPKKATEDELALIDAENAERADRNAERRRVRLAEALDGRDLSCVVLYQSEEQRDRIIRTAEQTLGLAPHRTGGEPGTWTWRTDELTVRLCAEPLAELGAPFGGEKPPRKGKELDKAIDRRSKQAAARLAGLSEKAPGPQLVLAELEGKGREEAFAKSRRRADPKFAIRLGCADAGTVTQFFRPLDRTMTSEEAAKDADLRIRAAWLDGLRQTGLRFVPEHTLGDALPPDLNQVAFWLVKRRHDGPTGKPQFTPVAVLIRPGEKSVMGQSPDTGGWVPYPQLLTSLTGQVREEKLKSRTEQIRTTAIFVKEVLSKLRGRPTLVLTRAQNIRYRWPWLQNGNLIADQLSLGEGPLQRVALYGRRLRIVRVADSDRDETSQWWAPKELLHERHHGKQRGGFAKGLWVPHGRGTGGRVFYSTADKTSARSDISTEAAKLTPHVNEKGKNEFRPTKSAWNPEQLELTVACKQEGDDAEQWAMYVHQQRLCDDDYRDVLGLPLVLHLARLADEYALPHEDTEVTGPPEETEQLTLDLDEDQG